MLALVGTFAILGCSDDDDDDIRDVNVPALRITNANAAMLGGEDFTFAAGVRGFDTLASTTVEFNDNATGADIAAGGSTTSASAEYGSCIFTAGADSTFPTDSPLAPGSRVTIQRCILNITAPDVPVNGDPVTGVAILTFGLDESGAIEVDVQINESGRLFINEVDTGITITGSQGDTDD
jgi:hypothetical protein